MRFRVMVFPDGSVQGSAGRVKIAQCHIVHTIGHGKILHHSFDHQLGPPVNVSGNGGKILFNRCLFRFPIHRCGRRKHDMIYSCFMHGDQQMQRSFHIIIIILGRIRHGFAYQRRSGKMNDAVDFMFCQDMF